MQACYGIVFYLGKLAWPSHLLPLYEQDPSATPWEPSYLASLAVVILLTALSLWSRKRWPGLLICWLAYLLLLLPVLGLAQSGPQLVADRYTYLAAMPWGVLLAWLCAKILERLAPRPRARLVAWAAMVGVLLIFIVQSRSRVRVWRDEHTLWSTVVERAPQTGMAQANLALELNRRGEYALAIDHAQLALARLPGNRAAHLALGSAALQMGRYELAAEHLAVAVEIAEHIGRPDFAAMARLATALGGLGDRAGAKETFERLLARDPQEGEWEFQYGSFLASVGDYEAARAHLERAVQLRPGGTASYVRLAVVQRRLGNDREAVEVLRRGLRIRPGDVELQGELAWILATTADDSMRDGKQALSLAQAAGDASGGASRRVQEAIAAAYAETGDFTSAVEIVQRELSTSADMSPARRARLEAALALYQARKPYRD
jgi:tetratricopeptide (TPR) repeat protein